MLLHILLRACLRLPMLSTYSSGKRDTGTQWLIIIDMGKDASPGPPAFCIPSVRLFRSHHNSLSRVK